MLRDFAIANSIANFVSMLLCPARRRICKLDYTVIPIGYPNYSLNRDSSLIYTKRKGILSAAGGLSNVSKYLTDRNNFKH